MIKKEMKKIGILVTLVIMALVLAACAKAPAETTEEVIEEPEKEPVITYSDFRANNTVPEDKIPEYYTEVVINGIKDRVWGYTDEKGSIQYMVFTDQDTLTDGEVTETKNGFVPIEIASDETEEVVSETVVTEDVTLPANTEEKPIYSYAFKENAEFIEHKDEKPGKGTPVDIPEGSIVKTIVGAVNELNEKAGLYELVIDKLENPIVFAAFNLGEEDEVATFYPATEDGEMIEGALPLTCVYLEENGEKVATLPEDAVYDTTKKEDEITGANTTETAVNEIVSASDEEANNITDEQEDKNTSITTANSTANSGGQSNSSSQSSSQSQATSSSQSQATSSSQSQAQSSSSQHTHNWVAITETVHHDAVTEEVWVVDVAAQEAWDEVYYTDERGPMVYTTGDGMQWSTEEEAIDHMFTLPVDQRHYSTYRPLIQVEHVVHHDATPEQGHYETVVKQAAWDETVTTGYKCTCGARK